MGMRFILGALVGLVGVFALVGLAVMFGALRSARAERKRSSPEIDGLSLRARIGRYVGDVEPSMALLNPPGRVATEFFSALCGFPGLGWLLSGSVFTGLVLICVGPAFVWGIFPVFLVLTGKIASGAFIAVQYLPGLAIGSSSALAYREIQLARRRKRNAQVARLAE
jgi:hypothetical protein